MKEQISYNTKQKNAVLELLKNNSDKEFCAKTVYDCLIKQGVSVGKTTVYRALEKLVKEGHVVELPVVDKNGIVYQLRNQQCLNSAHIHLKCTMCGQMFHLDCALVQQLGEHLFSEHNFCIDREKTFFHGRCFSCEKHPEKDDNR